ncbi:hypothetical protein ACIRL2_45730 [Embleya sp. NPDC127516]
MNRIVSNDNPPPPSRPADSSRDGGRIDFDEALRRVREDAERRRTEKR